MRIEKFQIKGFKSIVDLTVEGLSDINVFFGLNDVGKSNIFQALHLWCLTVQQNGGSFKSDQMRKLFGTEIFRLGGTGTIEISVDLQLERGAVIGAYVKSTNNRLSSDLISFSCEAYERTIPSHGRSVSYREREALLKQLQFHIIDANRRVVREIQSTNEKLQDITSDNLKQSLFYAYLSSDLTQKQTLNAIKSVLAKSPYKLGDLDVALEPTTNEINIGFVRSEGRLPLENLGAGSQQLLLVLGQLFLNKHPMVALEEPEMNLSPKYQQLLMATLHELMTNSSSPLKQLFISTHSPYLEFAENFYDVTYDPVKGTQVTRATNERYNQHFSVTKLGPDTGARLNSLNQVELYEGVIRDLGLQRGDLVIFTPNKSGNWEVHSGKEIASELQQVTNGNVRKNGK